MATFTHPVTTSVKGWDPQNNHVERFLDNAAYTAAHPDDTLLLVGPARHIDVAWEATPNSPLSMMPLGMTQQFQVAQNVPVAPMPSIGTARTFYTRSKGQLNWSMARLWCNGRNLLRALYHNARSSLTDQDLLTMPEPVIANGSSQVFFNLDSEIFAAPIGLAVFFRDKSRRPLGAFYLESMMISSWSIGVAAGTGMIMSNVSGVADRILPIADNDYTTLRDNLDTVNSFLDETSLDTTSVQTA